MSPAYLPASGVSLFPGVGPAGHAGATGSAGTGGVTGATGSAAAVGATGPAGPTGVTGATGAATYVGPGNIVASASAWYGLRAYSGAYAASLGDCCILRRASDNATQTFTVLANGHFDIASATTFAGGSDLFVQQLFDQSGNGHHVTQGAAANQPKLVPNTIGTLPGLQFVGTSSQRLTTTTLTVNAQPVTLSWVAQRNGAFTTQGAIMAMQHGVNQPTDYFTTSANQIWMFAGTVRAVTAADSTWHTEQSVYNNSTTPGAILDGTATTLAGSPGSAAPGTFLGIGCDNTGVADTTFATMLWVEGGYWPIAFSTGQGSSMNTNAKGYWGF